ncbi:MAG: NAD(P)-binding protein [Thermodesulfobacteriota bacterium]|jgi:NADPH-dependent 2,4-dienoyl-CoA reductase/sulfur reductase-like enzyme
MNYERLVVIGGDAAGMSAATQARRRRPDLGVLVFERSPHTPYAACGIPSYVGNVGGGCRGADCVRSRDLP